MTLTIGLISWEFAPQFIVAIFVIGVSLVVSIMGDIDHTGVHKGQIWKNNFSGLKARVIKKEVTERAVFIYLIQEGEDQERRLPYNLFLSQYTQLSR